MILVITSSDMLAVGVITCLLGLQYLTNGIKLFGNHILYTNIIAAIQPLNKTSLVNVTF